MNWFDFVIIGVVALSGLLAMARGFVKELISLAGWIVAAIVTFMTYKYLSAPVNNIVKSQTIADIGSGIVIFLVVLIAWGLATHWFVKRLPAARSASSMGSWGWFSDWHAAPCWWCWPICCSRSPSRTRCRTGFPRRKRRITSIKAPSSWSV